MEKRKASQLNYNSFSQNNIDVIIRSPLSNLDTREERVRGHDHHISPEGSGHKKEKSKK
jgi:hypothetical protein